VKKVIELLEEARRDLIVYSRDEDYEHLLMFALSNIEKALDELKSPRWYTPKQWEAETGEAWPDDWGVYVWDYALKLWIIRAYETIKYCEKFNGRKYPVVCATEAGKPPDDWRPEETK
jgi:hypothetical protein